jgi:hypothetical protein
MQPFLIPALLRAFRVISFLTPYEFLKWLLTGFHRIQIDANTDTALVEGWVIINLCVSVVFSITVNRNSPHWLLVCLLVYVACRIWEAVVIYTFYTQILGGAPSGPRRKEPTLSYELYSYRRAVVLAMILYLELLFWFSTIYRITSNSFRSDGIDLDSFFSSLYYSLITMLTIGYGDISPIDKWGFIIVILQGIIGLFMTIFVLARIISCMPGPGTMDPAEQRPFSH